jgi:hypothetical protein
MSTKPANFNHTSSNEKKDLFPKRENIVAGVGKHPSNL